MTAIRVVAVLLLLPVGPLLLPSPGHAQATEGRLAQDYTVLTETPHFVAGRSGRFFVVELRTPHRVLSTSSPTEEHDESVRYLVNHQSMEATGHTERHDRIVGMPQEEYHSAVALELGLEPARTVVMGTAANMNYLGHAVREFRDLRVDAFVTAGVQGNATRSGDPASWYEGDDGMEYVADQGTINTVVVINAPLTSGAQTRAVMTMVEAKSAALAELAVPSRVTPHIATGTGTDQFILAGAIDATRPTLRGAGPHTKLGELIGDAVRSATAEALRWQNGLEPSRTRDITWALGRFGLSEEELLSRLEQALPASSYELLVRNRDAVLLEPRMAAVAYAYAAVLDRLQYGTLPPQIAGEALRDQAANVAVALSGRPALWTEFWTSIEPDADDRLAPFVTALALGWRARWAW